MKLKCSRTTCGVFAAAAVGVLAALAHAQTKYDFFLVDSFNANPLVGETFVYDINDQGMACGVATMDGGGYVGLVWDEVSGKTVVPVYNPLGINNSGLVVGNQTVYSIVTGELFQPSPLPGMQFGPAFAGVNDLGVAVGSAPICNCSNPNLITPYLWDQVNGGSPTPVPVSQGWLRRINNSGIAVGSSVPAATGEGFFVDLESSAYTWLGSLFQANFGFGPTRGYDINDSGAIVGTRYGYYPVYFYGYVYSPTTGLQILPFLGPPYQDAILPRGINDAGTIVGEVFILGSPRGFVYTPADGIRDLDDDSLVAGIPPGYDFYSTQKVSNTGWIVGYGHTAAGKITGFVLKPRGVAGDLSYDGIVDAADLGLLLGSWGACDGCPADLNDDGVVGPNDLALLLGNWG